MSPAATIIVPLCERAVGSNNTHPIASPVERGAAQPGMPYVNRSLASAAAAPA
ncbi:MAG: hypothetical protein V4857_04710 [Pseudomonadota bacterium]